MLVVKERMRGRRGKCPACAAPIDIPSAEAPPTPRVDDPKPKKALPATEAQKDYARDLGVQFDEDVDRRAMSKLIAEAVNSQTEARYNEFNALYACEEHATETRWERDENMAVRARRPAWGR
ncbi:MAG TPA: hypothetical protein VGX78_01340 [Pirellulales bacterium]|nr:hypothetical protein [Pirellulales bacterium]